MSQNVTATIENEVMLAKNGNLTSFSKLVALTQNLTTSIALSIVKDTDASEDVAQQVYIKIWQQLPSLKKDQSFLPWLRQITRYTAINFLRDSKAGKRLDVEQNEIILESLESDSEEFHSSLTKEQTNERLQELIEALPNENRELVLLYYREEESTQHVAQLLELSEANVRKKLSRTRKLLKEQWLKKYGKIVLSTAPGLGFTTLITNLVTNTSPVVAATISSSVVASKTSLWNKFWVFLGGAAIGALAGIIAVLISTKMLINSIEDKSYIDDLKQNRNRMVGWIIFCMILLTLSYQFTSGWIAPFISYLLFAIGLIRLVEISQLLAAKAGIKKDGVFCLHPHKHPWKTRLVNWLGPLTGGIGLFIGLYESGRLIG